MNRPSLPQDPDLLDLGFLIHNVLTNHWIKLFDFHLIWHRTLVLSRRVEMTGAGRRYQLDFISHGI
jgi:hypothetical protein